MNRSQSSRSRTTKLGLGVLILMVVAVAGVASSVDAAGLRSELSVVAGEDAINADQSVLLRFSLKNTSDQDAFVLAYETPLKGFERELFAVDRDGEPIPYAGILALRVGPTAEDWIRIEAGGEVSAVIDLSSVYDTRRAGNYSVRYTAVHQVFRAVDKGSLPALGKEFQGEAIASDVVGFSIVGDAVIEEEPAELAGRDPEATYGCSSPSTLTTAQSSARSRVGRAANAATSYTTWYRTWFGATSSYVSTVRGRFSNSYSRLGQTVNYYCGSYAPYCTSNTIAYTYKTTSNRIYICSAFWNQTASFRAHAVAHESFHWNTVAGADDVTYGYSQCQSLASSRPYDALRNADNYAYAADYAP